MQIDILSRIKDQVEQNNLFVYVKNENDINDGWFWVGTTDGIIGNNVCHYEFIFYEEDSLCLEVHLDEKKKYPEFERIQIPNFLEFQPWFKKKYKFGKIVFNSNEYIINISKEERIVEKAINLLKKLHNAIGEELRQIIQNSPIITPINQIELLHNDNNNVVNEIHYRERTATKAKTFNSIHGKIQKKLKQELEDSNEYKCVYLESYIKKLGYRIDLVAIKQDDRYEIFEVKPYPSATECIREALGQILHYYHLLKVKYQIGKLVIVGPSSLNRNDTNFLKTLNDSLCGITLEYREVSIR